MLIAISQMCDIPCFSAIKMWGHVGATWNILYVHIEHYRGGNIFGHMHVSLTFHILYMDTLASAYASHNNQSLISVLKKAN